MISKSFYDAIKDLIKQEFELAIDKSAYRLSKELTYGKESILKVMSALNAIRYE